MTTFHRTGERLTCGHVDLETVARDVGTPLYVYSAKAMRSRLEDFQGAFAHRDTLICYAVKANHTLAVIGTLAEAGAGADTVSGGEIERALVAGVPPDKIVFAGVGKTDEEIRFALQAGVLQLNVESVPELERINAVATRLGVTAPVALRINPDVEAGGHDKISTGRQGDKFGIDLRDAHAAYQRARELASVSPVGLHLHIGSQITSLQPFDRAFAIGASLYKELRRDGCPLRRFDLGGGLGVRYRDETPFSLEAFSKLIDRHTLQLNCSLVLEPGRALVAEAGLLISKVIETKTSSNRRFLVLDAGMDVFARPAIYGAYHEVLPLRLDPSGDLLPHDVVGPICESSDIVGRDRLLPSLKPGALVGIECAGAYGASMASHYNSRKGAAEVLIDGDRWHLIKKRPTVREQMQDERWPLVKCDKESG